MDLLLQGLKWHSHLTGQIAIIKARSPYEYQHGTSHQLFAEARYALVSLLIHSKISWHLHQLT
jgi:hypothetical protein